MAGRKEGGIARAKALTKEERRDIAKQAAQARWELPVAEYAGELKFGELSFPCAVLSDGTRVLTETDFMSGLGMYRSGALSVRREQSEDGSAQTPLYLAFKNLEPFVAKHLGDVHVKPLRYRTLTGGTAKGGIPATIIPKICSVWLDARKAGVLGERQKQIADRAEMLLRGLAEVGIIALVDEATGYQNDRAKDALAKILEAFVAKEIQPYIKTFPSDYYEQLFRLYGLPYPPAGNSSWRPQFFGKITNEIVYARLAPNLIPQLKKIASKAERKAKMHQALTQDIGHPKLREHLASIVAIQKLSPGPKEFLENVNRVHPRYGQTLPLFEDMTDSAHDGQPA